MDDPVAGRFPSETDVIFAVKSATWLYGGVRMESGDEFADLADVDFRCGGRSTPADLADAAQLMSDLAALVNAGLVEAWAEAGGLARYGVSPGLEDLREVGQAPAGRAVSTNS